MNHTASALTTIAFAAGFAATAASAQVIAPVQAPSATLPSPSTQLAFPGTFGVPSAVAPRPNTGFVGLTLATPRGGLVGSGGDGDFVAGYSIGNPLDAVSLTFGLAVTGLQPFGDAGGLSVTASRMLQASGNSATFIGASASNIAGWGVNAIRDVQYSVYLSHLVGVQTAGVEIPLQFVVGYGTDNTRSTTALGTTGDGAFAGIGVGLTQNLSGSISATQTQINAGMSYGIPNTSISTSFGVVDVTNNTSRRQVTLSVAYGF